MRAFPSSVVLALAWAMSAPASVDSIREMIRAGRFPEAVTQCDVELKASPASAPLWTLRGLALRGAGDTAGAVAAWRRAGNYLPALQALAQVEFDTRDAAARGTLENLMRLAPQSPARWMLATLQFEARECAAVVRTLASAAEPPPGARWQLGVCLYETQRYAEAATQFAALLRLREHAPTRFNLALAQWQLRDYRAAAATLARAEEADAMHLLGAAQQAAGDVPQALAVLQRGIERHPGDPRFVIELAALCLEQGNTALGAQVAEAGLRRHPDSAELATLQGVLWVRGGEIEKGEAALRAAEQRSPLGRIGLASLLMQMGLPAEAAKLLERDAHAVPADDRAIVTYARAVLQQAPSRAVATDVAALLRGAVQRDPRNGAAQGLLGRVLSQQGDLAGAAAALNAALVADPADRASLYQLMTLYRRQGRAQEAAALARRLVSTSEKERTNEQRRFELVRAQ